MGFTATNADNLYVRTVTIASGASASEAFESLGLVPATIFMPAAWTAAKLRLQGSSTEAGTFRSFKDTTGSVLGGTDAIAAAANDPITLVGQDVAFSPYYKLLSEDGAGTPVVQSAARVLTIVMRKYLS